METTKFEAEDLAKLRKTVELIKNILIARDEEGTLTNWARKELNEARAEPNDNLISLDDLRNDIQNGL